MESSSHCYIFKYSCFIKFLFRGTAICLISILGSSSMDDIASFLADGKFFVSGFNIGFLDDDWLVLLDQWMGKSIEREAPIRLSCYGIYSSC